MEWGGGGVGTQTNTWHGRVMCMHALLSLLFNVNKKRDNNITKKWLNGWWTRGARVHLLKSLTADYYYESTSSPTLYSSGSLQTPRSPVFVMYSLSTVRFWPMEISRYFSCYGYSYNIVKILDNGNETYIITTTCLMIDTYYFCWNVFHTPSLRDGKG